MCQLKCMVDFAGVTLIGASAITFRFRRVCTPFFAACRPLLLADGPLVAIIGPCVPSNGREGTLRDMLIRLTRQMRVRAAIALAVVYSLCLIFPPVAFGFADGKLATHCLGVVLDTADSSNIGRPQH